MSVEVAAFAPRALSREICWFRNAGHFFGDENYIHSLPQGVPSVTALLTIAGQGSYRLGPRTWAAEEQTVTLLRPCKTAVEWKTRGKKWEFLWLSGKGSQCTGYLGQFGVSSNIMTKRLCLNDFNELQDSWMKLISKERQTSPHSRFSFQRAALGVMLSLLEAAILGSETKPSRQIYNKDVFAIVDRYLSRSQPTPDRVDEVAKIFNSTTAHVSRVFKAAVGISLKDYMIQHRVNQAKQLLAESSLTVESVGEKVGYPDVYHFSRLFKRRAGVPPSHFRKNYWH